MIGQEENGEWREGASGRQKQSLNDRTWVGEPAHTHPDDPSAPVYSCSMVTFPHCHAAPGCLSRLSFLLHHSLSPGCWYDQRQALRETSLSTDITPCLSHTCLKCLLLIPSDASHQPANEQLWQGERERQRETETEEGRGRKGASERPVYFARLTENSPKCWAGITLSNIDCDFLREKQPALVNLEWLWNNLASSHIVECQERNALQQFVATL